MNESTPKFVPGKNRKIKFVNGQNFEYEIFKIVDEYNPILSEPTIPWDFNNPPGDLRYIHMSMVQTMAKNGGVGLAANQCGLKYRTFVMGVAGYVVGVVNPEIISVDGQETSQEGCLSFPGVYLKIKRSTHIEVKYWDMNGVEQSKKFDGLTARIFLHEYDHLNGVTFKSHVNSIEYRKSKDKAKTNIRRMKRAREEAEHKQSLLDRFQKLYSNKQSSVPVVNVLPDYPKSNATIILPNAQKSNIEKTAFVMETLNSLISTEK
jgi:peptide deformylase